jgi:hypothetical protein
MNRIDALLALCVFPLLGSACGNDDVADGPEGGAEGGAPTTSGGQGGSTSGGSTSGGSTAGGGAATGGGACYGDATVWNAMTAAPPECTANDDCCVVINDCLSSAQVVHADSFEEAPTAWPYCDEDCNDCIPPSVVVTCDNGRCVGTVDETSDERGVSHCGDGVPAGAAPGQSFECQ